MRTLCALVAVLLIAGPVLAGGTAHADQPLAFSPVPDYGARLERVVHGGRDDIAPRIRVPVVHEVSHAPDSVALRPRAAQYIRADVASRSVPRATGHHAAGTASWYCCARGYLGGLYAAAGPALRVGHWRGTVVTVHAAGRAIRVRLIDWCACPKRLIDLYSDAFSRLAPLNRGLLKVEVTW